MSPEGDMPGVLRGWFDGFVVHGLPPLTTTRFEGLDGDGLLLVVGAMRNRAGVFGSESIVHKSVQ